MNCFRDTGVLVGLLVVLAGGVLVQGVESSDDVLYQINEYGNRDYALNAMALKYLQEFTDDEQLMRDTASMYWCWTPVIEQWGRIPQAEKSEVILRARAKQMVARRSVGQR